jgi:hypothetical protein
MSSSPVEARDDTVEDEAVVGKRWPFLSPRPDTGVGTRPGSRGADGVVGMRMGWATEEEMLCELVMGRKLGCKAVLVSARG